MSEHPVVPRSDGEREREIRERQAREWSEAIRLSEQPDSTYYDIEWLLSLVSDLREQNAAFSEAQETNRQALLRAEADVRDLREQVGRAQAISDANVDRAVHVYYGWDEHEAVFNAAKEHYGVGLDWDFSAEKYSVQDRVRLRAVLLDFAVARETTP